MFNSKVQTLPAVLMAGGRDLLEKLKNDSQLLANSSAKHGLADMSLLFNYVDALDAASHV
jgi:histidyl-tRNA synthetase